MIRPRASSRRLTDTIYSRGERESILRVGNRENVRRLRNNLPTRRCSSRSRDRSANSRIKRHEAITLCVSAEVNAMPESRTDLNIRTQIVEIVIESNLKLVSPFFVRRNLAQLHCPAYKNALSLRTYFFCAYLFYVRFICNCNLCSSFYFFFLFLHVPLYAVCTVYQF